MYFNQTISGGKKADNAKQLQLVSTSIDLSLMLLSMID